MFLQPEQKTHRIWPYAVGLIFLLIFSFSWTAYKWFERQSLASIVKLPIVDSLVRSQAGDTAADALTLLPELLGEKEPKIYLILFLNNTELRPGGGFIGVYGLVKADKGYLSLIRVSGSETLDAAAPKNFKTVPPKPLADYLGVDKFYFRDGNWSPDWQESAKKVLDLYKAEGGEDADSVDAVVGVTPTILEELLRLTGSVTVQGITFTADNVVEKLEYEVEYGFFKRGVSVEERKQIIKPLSQVILSRLNNNILSSYKKYIDTFKNLAAEKQIMLYSEDSKIADLADKLGLAGKMSVNGGDYLMWVDANLGALKTDHAIVRNLLYRIEPDEVDGYKATVAMTYKHTGVFDWRTTRYRTYARVYAPKGATLLGVDGSMKTDRSADAGKIDQGEEFGKQWFGTFISIEPGKSGTLVFKYKLPKDVDKMVENGSYGLYVQKQLGGGENGLTLDLNFDRTITASVPEDVGAKGDGKYKYEGDLRVDRAFNVKF